MIDQQASNALAQIGWVRYPYYFGTNVCYFWEYEEPYAIVSNGPIFISVVPSPALGGADQFGVTNYTTDGAMHFYLNGVIKHMLTPDWAPDDAEFNGEVVRDSADTMPQMPGDTSYQCYYADTDSSINVYYTDTRAWIKVHPNSGNWYWGVGSGYSGHSVNSDDTWMRIWDTRYSTEGSE